MPQLLLGSVLSIFLQINVISDSFHSKGISSISHIDKISSCNLPISILPQHLISSAGSPPALGALKFCYFISLIFYCNWYVFQH